MLMLRIRLEQKYAKRSLSLRIVTYLIEYLGEFEFIFETVLGYVFFLRKTTHIYSE
jgi:hypothetical protein